MTKLVIRERGGGKTRAMLEWAHESVLKDLRPVLLSHTDIEARRVRNLYAEMYGEEEASVVRFHTYSQARSGAISGTNTRIGIDNLDMLLRHLFGYPVDTATFTYEANA